MLVALDSDKKWVRAEQAPKEGQYFCPACQAPVFLKKGPIRYPHFSHYAKARCWSMAEGETEEHIRGKTVLYEELKGEGRVYLEYYLDKIDQRPDVLIKGDKDIAVEFQCSPISLEELSRRTLSYWLLDMEVVWILGSRYRQSGDAYKGLAEKFLQVFTNQSFVLKFLNLETKVLEFEVFQPGPKVTSPLKKKVYRAPISAKSLLAPTIIRDQAEHKRVFQTKHARRNYQAVVKLRQSRSPQNLKILNNLYERGEHLTRLPLECLVDVREEFLIKTPSFYWKLLVIRWLEGKETGQVFSKWEVLHFMESQVKQNELSLLTSPFISLQRKFRPVLYFMAVLQASGLIASVGPGQWQFLKKANRPALEEDLLKGLDEVSQDVSPANMW